MVFNKQNAVKGSIFGLAIGDALGGPIEGMSVHNIQMIHTKIIDLIGGGMWELRPGQYTDDTALALCIANSLIEKKGFDPKNISDKYVTWLNSDPFDIGITTKEAMINLRKGISPYESGIRDAEANGGVMRCAPVGLAASYSLDNVDKYSRIETSITHASELAKNSCAMVNTLIAKLIKDTEWNLAINETLNKYSRLSDIINRTDKIINPTGHLPQTLSAVFYSLHTSDNFEDTLIKAVNLGGDADTVGAITGAIAGARYGFSSIPKRWHSKIEDAIKLTYISEELTKLSQKPLQFFK